MDIDYSSLSKATQHRMLQVAMAHGDKQKTKLLIEKGAPVSSFSFLQSGANYANSPLHYAVSPMSDLEITKLLLSKGSKDINAIGKHHLTPLQLACNAKNEKMAKLLLKSGADVNVRNKDGETALQSAIANHAPEIARVLVENGADVHAKSKNGETALHVAANSRYHEIMELLLTFGADVNVRNNQGETGLNLVVEKGCNDAVRDASILLDHGAEIDAKDASQLTPLQRAVRSRGKVELVKLLLERGANPDVLDVDGATLLLRATKTGCPDILAHLLEHGADVNCSRTSDGFTPLHVAVFATEPKVKSALVLTLLLRAGADLNAPNFEGATPFMYFIDTMNLNERRALELKEKDAQWLADLPPLGRALQRLVMEKRLSLDKPGITPLYLVKLGARLDVKSKSGASALDRLAELDTIEIPRMKEKSIDRYTTLYDLLADFDKMLAHARNQDLGTMLLGEEFQKDYPKFAGIFGALYERAAVRRELLEKAHYALMIVSGLNVPEVCSHRIFENFSDKQLKQFGDIFTVKDLQ